METCGVGSLYQLCFNPTLCMVSQVQASKIKRKLNATELQLERAKKESASISHNHNKNFLLAVIK
eukprot:1945170-Rhodomonas_salina.1